MHRGISGFVIYAIFEKEAMKQGFAIQKFSRDDNISHLLAQSSIAKAQKHASTA
jgi:hypothetical protein